jgi:hypothetical protein
MGSPEAIKPRCSGQRRRIDRRRRFWAQTLAAACRLGNATDGGRLGSPVACAQKGAEEAELGGRAPAEVGTRRRSSAATDESRGV